MADIRHTGNRPTATATDRRRGASPRLWTAGALAIAALAIFPVLAVIWIALHPADNIWPHLIATTLPRYAANTLILTVSVGALSAAVGTGTAWLLCMYRFPGSRWLEWLLLLPLAIPAYVGAYALVDFLEYAGPVQTSLREIFGWQDARDYRFPRIRSRGGAVIVLTSVLFPYVYLLARAAFREHSGACHEVARTLGAGPAARFLRVGLPLARPAIAAGTAVVMMETVADFGTVEFFAVQTLTTGIFTTWLETGNAGGAAQIAGVVLLLVLLLIGLEKSGRRRNRYHNAARQSRPNIQTHLDGWQGWTACLLCVLPFAAGFVLPVSVIGTHALSSTEAWFDPGLLDALTNTLWACGLAALLTVISAFYMVYGVRLTGRRLPALLLPLAATGYAAPGAVLAVGILIPLAALDHMLADGTLWLTGRDPGLLLTGSAAALIYAWVVRFFVLAQGAADAAFGRIPPSLPMAARSLGRTVGGVLREIHVPLIRGSTAIALLLVFVDCAKELPATLLLRPFNFNTLSTRVYERASLENLEDAAPAAMFIILVGICAVIALARSGRRY